MKGRGEFDAVRGGGMRWETNVVKRCKTKAGLRRIAGRR
jgi:hypothetical protein